MVANGMLFYVCNGIFVPLIPSAGFQEYTSFFFLFLSQEGNSSQITSIEQFYSIRLRK